MNVYDNSIDIASGAYTLFKCLIKNQIFCAVRGKKTKNAIAKIDCFELISARAQHAFY